MLSPLSPSKGSAIFFSSGWENIHKVCRQPHAPLIPSPEPRRTTKSTTQDPPHEAPALPPLSYPHAPVVAQVEPLISGSRIAVPAFFTTQPPPEELLADVPVGDAAIADALRRTLVSPESVAQYREFVMLWHRLLAPDR